MTFPASKSFFQKLPIINTVSGSKKRGGSLKESNTGPIAKKRKRKKREREKERERS
jgi:hypothetical protein